MPCCRVRKIQNTQITQRSTAYCTIQRRTEEIPAGRCYNDYEPDYHLSKTIPVKLLTPTAVDKKRRLNEITASCQHLLDQV